MGGSDPLNCKIVHEMAVQRAESSGFGPEVSVCFLQSGNSLRAKRVKSDPRGTVLIFSPFPTSGSQFNSNPFLMNLNAF